MLRRAKPFEASIDALHNGWVCARGGVPPWSRTDTNGQKTVLKAAAAWLYLKNP